ncbi:MAG: hypothetical protein GVY28_05195 [Alphaproteobacteria bacterium]|jgi:hypothetical protein|nr:hypothetical protein [Alphaproteobacteria bacterium]
MADTPTVTKTEFIRDCARFVEEARHGTMIEVADGNEVVGAFISAEDLADLHRLKAREARSLLSKDLPDDIASEIENAVYGQTPN